nr:hypothetical protein [Tanacetum cinerariifolium]
FFIISSIAVQTPDSSISKLLEVETTFTGSGNLYCQWELSSGSGNALVHSWSSGSGSYILLSSTHNSISLSLDAGLMLSKPHDESSSQVPKGSGNPNPTVSSSNPIADQMETLRMESSIPTVSSPVLTACLNDSPEPSSEARLISKRVANQEDTPSLDNILHRQIASPTPTLRIHKDHPKCQIIGPVDTPIQTKHKSKIMEEQSFIATIHQKTDPALLQFCLFSCFLSQVKPKKVSDALQDPSWVEAMQEKLL